jgi:hypothetical protein
VGAVKFQIFKRVLMTCALTHLSQPHVRQHVVYRLQWNSSPHKHQACLCVTSRHFKPEATVEAQRAHNTLAAVTFRALIHCMQFCLQTVPVGRKQRCSWSPVILHGTHCACWCVTLAPCGKHAAAVMSCIALQCSCYHFTIYQLASFGSTAAVHHDAMQKTT